MELYIHIPFCRAKCSYCDFLSFAGSGEIQKKYFEALHHEVLSYRNGEEMETVSSIFFGGGTPSLPDPSYISRVMEDIGEVFVIEPDAEISIEANPGTVTRDKLQHYRRSGINRISFGCQSADDEELRKIGRIHTWEGLLESWSLARQAGFSNINLDLMFSLPGQTLFSWETSLKRAAALGPEHISAYSLILEEGTPLFKSWERDPAALALAGEEEEREMFEATAGILGGLGYRQYEISNYAREGRECRHNLGYWTGLPYLGLGLGASSCYGGRRFHNTASMAEYLSLRSGADPELIRRDQEILTSVRRQEEFMFLGLRLIRGVDLEEFQRRFGVPAEEVYGPVIRRHTEAGLLTLRGSRLALTRRGLSLSNRVMADFLQD